MHKLGDRRFDSGQVSDRNDRSINDLQVKHPERYQFSLPDVGLHAFHPISQKQNEGGELPLQTNPYKI